MSIIHYLTEHWIEILGTLTGVVYLYQELKASIYMWVTGIIMPAISLYVYYNAGLYADFGINIYYLLAAVYGYMVWRFGKKKDGKPISISFTPRRKYWQLILCFTASFIAIGFLLQKYTDSNVPWWDSFTTALSIVGMWMLARKWIEQWWAWIAVDAVCTGLYVYKDIPFYAALYGLYTIIAVYGYFKWKKLMIASSSPQVTIQATP